MQIGGHVGVEASLAADPPSPDDVASGAARTARRGSSKHCHSSIFLLIISSLVKWRLTDWIRITGSNPNSCASLEDSGTPWVLASGLNGTGWELAPCASR